MPRARTLVVVVDLHHCITVVVVVVVVVVMMVIVAVAMLPRPVARARRRMWNNQVVMDRPEADGALRVRRQSCLSTTTTARGRTVTVTCFNAAVFLVSPPCCCVPVLWSARVR